MKHGSVTSMDPNLVGRQVRLALRSYTRVSAHDVFVHGFVLILLAGAGLVASYIPARRAMRVDPVVALRYQ
jgi:ABC-type lipoprotein release transport system permease subunit